MVSLALCAAAATAQAAPPAGRDWLVQGPETSARWQQQALAWLAENGSPSVGAGADPAAHATPMYTASARQLTALGQVEGDLAEARSRAAGLDEGGALAALGRARKRLLGILQLPGVGTWLAEVDTQIGLVAAQAGMRDLAESALRRAVSIDPSRVVQAAEARPETVQLARRLARAHATAALGRVRVRCQAPGAQVWINGEGPQRAPRQLSLRQGTHLLRVEAPGYQAYAALMEVYEGERPPIDVSLTPLPRVERRQQLAREAAEAGADRPFVETWTAKHPERVVWLLQGAMQRAVLSRCQAGTCDRHVGLERDPGGLRSASIDIEQSETWLRDGAGGRVQPAPAWYRRWPVWVGTAVVAGAAVGAAVWLRPTEREQRRTVLVDPGDLATGP